MELADPNCRSCKGHGLNFPDDTRACPAHTTPQWREHLADLDRRAKTVTAKAWPYGPNVDVRARIDLLDWAEPLGVRRSSNRCNALHWLRTGRCSSAVGSECTPFSWMDHTTSWMLDSKPALVLTQPYSTADRLRERMGGLLRDEGLRIEFEPGWYGYGTIGAFIWRKDAHEKLSRRA
ncbi:hypothetical protein [Nocardiopsis synnemataformans]|uniref:hypothetical protein n=1 Tax=Nocardiopsis synnemataformans TaxID=61305 RepID=UPI003EBDDD23